MRITLNNDVPTAVSADLIAIGLGSQKPARGSAAAALLSATGGAPFLKAEGFEGKPGQAVKVPGGPDMKAKGVLFVGLGDATGIDAARLVAHTALKLAGIRKAVAVVLGAAAPEEVRAAAQEAVLGAYRYLDYKTRGVRTGPGRTVLVVEGKKSSALKAAVEAGLIVGECASLARDLVNAPPNDLNPVTLAERAQAEAKALDLQVKVLGKRQLEKLGMNLFLAVNRGSAIEPRFIHITYAPKNAEKKVAFVGKGLTFDAGGLCLKPAKSMVDMKCDMAGAAVTLGVVLAAARLQLPVEVHAIIGSTENMTGDAAYRPGDVFTSLDGKTVEVINTDAEGRMVLADCLAWTRDQLQPDILIDHATLTGAAMVALGPHRTALYTADDDLADQYLVASEAADERYWRMPLDDDLRPMLDSFVADLKHVGGPHGGSITAALFLREFVGESTWIHCDIAGPSFNDGPHRRMPKGGTGHGVATAVRFLESL
ncbi:MAG: leucyl aminopeptidase [Myxococcota bacterium]